MSEIIKIKSAADTAGDYHNQGFNCAESIFLTFRGLVTPNLSEDIVRLATPFGGGLGRSGCICGALSGAVMIIGAATGRITSMTPRKQSYELTMEYHNRFRYQFGATCCRVLVKDEFGSKEQGEKCFKIITESADLLINFLYEKRIILKK